MLELLASDYFEPFGKLSLLDLTRKTPFLVAVTCGRRGSEIQAFFIDKPRLLWRRDGVFLLPRAGVPPGLSFSGRALGDPVVPCTRP